MRLRLRSPREVATLLRERARRRPREVAEYLEEHPSEWGALAAADPHDAADILEELGEEGAAELITELAPGTAADVLEELRDDLSADLLVGLPLKTSLRILEQMPAEEAADIVAEIDEEAPRRELLESLEEKAGQDLRRALAYPTDSAGGLMSFDVASLPAGMTAGEAIEVLRTLHKQLDDLSYVYITDDGRRLVGVLSFRDLVFARPGEGLDQVMVQNPVSVGPLADREEVAELTQRYGLFGLPVVDSGHRLMGAVSNEEVMEAIQQEASEDFAAAVGAGAEETVYTRIPASVRHRAPWLVLNLLLAALITLVVDQFTDIIDRHEVLAALMPLVAILGGNAGAQTLAVVIRALATDDLPRSEIPGVLGRQITVGAVNGVIIGVLAGAVALLFSGVAVAGVVGVAAAANLVVATLAGAAIPLTLRAVGLDPALAANIFLTLITDLVGFGGFLAVATAWL